MKYFAADTPDKTVDTLNSKAKEWFDTILENDYINKLKASWNAYHGSYYSDGHEITFGGEQGELVNLPINHYRNIATHMKNMVSANRPAFQARATNTDSKSEIQTELANGLLEYYMREKKMERFLIKALEYAIVLGSGYIKMEWNSTSGEIYDTIPMEPEIDEDGNEVEVEAEPVYEGDVLLRNMSPFDVVFDSTKETSEEHDWVLCRTFKNKFDLAAKYPELRDKIISLKTKSDHEKQRLTSHYSYDKTDDVPVYEFFHKKTESLPNGRYLLYLDTDVILEDTSLIYRDLPIYRISASDILGTSYGYTSMFDLLPIQDAVNSLYSTVLTNQNAFGVQNILNPRGNDIRLNQLEGAMQFIEYTPIPNSPTGGRPEALNLTQTPPEIFNFLQMLERAMETVSGINSVARGNPESSLKSGSALALVQSNALQFISGLQHSYVQIIEDVGTGLVNLLRDFAKAPRIAAIAGLGNRSKIVKFSGDDLSLVNRVVVDVGNPLSQSTAGRVQMAEQLLQMQLIDSPEKYLEVMNTGNLKTMTKSNTDDATYVRVENEALLTGETPVVALFIDKHSLHIREHRAVLADPVLRASDPQLIARVSKHIQEHIDLLRNTDPATLSLIGEQPIGPPAGSPPSMDNAAANQPTQSSMEGGEVANQMQVEEAAGVGSGANELPSPNGESPKVRLPKPATPPDIPGQ